MRRSCEVWIKRAEDVVGLCTYRCAFWEATPVPMGGLRSRHKLIRLPVKRSKRTVGFYSCLVSEQALIPFLTILSDARSENLQTGTSANPVQTVDEDAQKRLKIKDATW